VHGAVAGMKQCSSTLDADPFDRCRAKCEIGSLFCENHVDFPDMGRRAGIYGDSCKRRRVDPTVAEFMAVAYPGAAGNVAIHDIALYVLRGGPAREDGVRVALTPRPAATVVRAASKIEGIPRHSYLLLDIYSRYRRHA
jgi:hypothetical protein